MQKPGLRLYVPPHSASTSVAESPQGGGWCRLGGVGEGGELEDKRAWSITEGEEGPGRLVSWDQESEGSTVSGAATTRGIRSLDGLDWTGVTLQRLDLQFSSDSHLKPLHHPLPSPPPSPPTGLLDAGFTAQWQLLVLQSSNISDPPDTSF